jgi:hypothetical protein
MHQARRMDMKNGARALRNCHRITMQQRFLFKHGEDATSSDRPMVGYIHTHMGEYIFFKPDYLNEYMDTLIII